MIAVTGATGFVGRRIAEALARRGDAVRALVRDPARAPMGMDAHAMDLRADAIDPRCFDGVKTLVHVAAYLPPSYADPRHAEECLLTNGLGTLNLLRAASAHGVTHAIVFSSGNAYRTSLRVATEDDPLYPAARAPYYLTSKLCGEIYATALHESGAIRVAVFRPSAVYGTGMAQAGVVPTFTTALLAGKPIRIADGGRHSVDFVHVDDVVAATLAAIDARAIGAFNIGSGSPTTTLTLGKTLVAVVGAAEALLEIEPPQGGDAPRGFATLDVRRAQTELAFAPRSLAEGLGEYVASRRRALSPA